MTDDADGEWLDLRARPPRERIGAWHILAAVSAAAATVGALGPQFAGDEWLHAVLFGTVDQWIALATAAAAVGAVLPRTDRMRTALCGGFLFTAFIIHVARWNIGVRDGGLLSTFGLNLEAGWGLRLAIAGTLIGLVSTAYAGGLLPSLRRSRQT